MDYDQYSGDVGLVWAIVAFALAGAALLVSLKTYMR